jgi:hypothetical protein
MRGVIVHMLASSAVDQGFEPRPGQTKERVCRSNPGIYFTYC